MRQALIALGVMTGNSLDAVDTVITRFAPTGEIRDAFNYSLPIPLELAEELRAFRAVAQAAKGDIKEAERNFNPQGRLSALHDRYLKTVADACLATIIGARTCRAIEREESPDVIGFHGQTCAHRPPSIAKSSGGSPYTVQLGDGQALASLLGIPVVYDFRSDDVMNGGEGAPFAPMHHLHLALHAKRQGEFPIAFINGGNTGNISIITNQLGKKDLSVLGWDTGPFNHYPDLLARRELGRSCDTNGEIGLPGNVNKELLRLMFNKSVVTADGSNFLIQQPPRSSDPQWYQELPEILGLAPVAGAQLSLADRMRTAEYFAAYLVMFSLSFIPSDREFPHFMGLCGGGWKNPVVTNHFRYLMRNSPGQIILEEHETMYSTLMARIGKRPTMVESTSAYGFDPNSMEARIFADAAVHLVWGEPFSQPSVTGTKAPTKCGRIRFPAGKEPRSFTVGKMLFDSGDLIEAQSTANFKDPRFGRAVAGWSTAA